MLAELPMEAALAGARALASVDGGGYVIRHLTACTATPFTTFTHGKR